MTGISIVIGFALGLPPLVAQAYGAQNYIRCGELLQRTIMIHLLLIVPLGDWIYTPSSFFLFFYIQCLKYIYNL